ncbi:DUF4387 domain-containing protein [Rhodococcus sp. 1R11]|uniref:DUF4387 domain-containing protein n=1 Tax=Rhodococcus sp. 1R11 TaxID=2559614 RepID=UPI0010724B25|nr:DUF4387 domain-containing protein [Rhodococcus sp. 1R11]TFI40417.1 DUF4387 domain-containing protein [Rhodococcus sp. 1R11]
MITSVALGDLASKIRSKNAGPFWVTIDIFFPDRESYADAAAEGTITPDSLSAVYGVPENSIKIFRLDQLHAIKISYPRAIPQGSIHDRDIHAAQQYIPLLTFRIPFSNSAIPEAVPHAH